MKVPVAESELTLSFFNAILPLGKENKVTGISVEKLKAGGLSGALLFKVKLEYAVHSDDLPTSVVA